MTVTTALHLNPFCLLGATTRDDRHRIVALAEAKGLVLDSETCEKARAGLTNLRTRISAEIAWLPGLAPARARELLAALQTDTDLACPTVPDSFPALASANLIAAAFERLPRGLDSPTWCEWILALANNVAAIDADEVLRSINGDREVAGFPTIKSQEVIEGELTERMRYYKETVKSALNELPSQNLVGILTSVVEKSTRSGTKHAPLLIDEVVDGYQADTLGFFTKQAENVTKLIERVRAAASQADGSIAKAIDSLDSVLRKWHWVARPIQLSMKARGLDHRQSLVVAYQVRRLSVDLFNKHCDIASARRLTKLLGEVFADLPEFASRVQQDERVLAQISGAQSGTSGETSPVRKGGSARAPNGTASWKFWGWATAIVVVGIWLANQGGSKSTVTPAESRRVESSEQRPAVGDGLVLSAAEIRYCLAQEIRVTGMEKAVNQYSASSVAGYNRAVADYNSRCSRFRYRSGMLEAARKEVERQRAALELEGMQRMLSYK